MGVDFLSVDLLKDKDQNPFQASKPNSKLAVEEAKEKDSPSPSSLHKAAIISYLLS